MRELIRTNDPVVIGLVRSLLEEAGIPVLVADDHMSLLEGSIGVFPRRLMVPTSAAEEGLRLIEEAGLAEWIYRP